MIRVGRVVAGFTGLALFISGVAANPAWGLPTPEPEDQSVVAAADPTPPAEPPEANEQSAPPSAEPDDDAPSPEPADPEPSEPSDEEPSDEAPTPEASDTPSEPADDGELPLSPKSPAPTPSDGLPQATPTPSTPSPSGEATPTPRGGIVPMAGALTKIEGEVLEDGNDKSSDDYPVSFAQNGPVLGLNGQELDHDAHNGIVATNDSVLYEITATQTETPGTQTMVAELPPGMEWDPAAAAWNENRCDKGASLSDDKLTLTCSWTNDGEAWTYVIRARAWAYALGNGATVAPTFYDTDTSGESFDGPPVTVVAQPRTEIRILADSVQPNTTGPGGVQGVSFAYSVTEFVRAVSSGGTGQSGRWADVRGFELLDLPYQYVLDVPDGVVVTSDDDGSWSQDGAGGDITMVESQQRSSMAYLRSGGVFPNVDGQRIEVFVPHDPNVPPGAVTYLNAELKAKSFDPNGLGGMSNFGDGFAPGQDGLPVCPTNANSLTEDERTHCATVRVDRTSGVAEIGGTFTSMYPPTARSGGALADYLPIGAVMTLVPGQQFLAMPGLANDDDAGASGMGTFGCMVWDAEQLSLADAATPITQSPVTLGMSLGSVALAQDRYVLEYASLGLADDEARRTFACGVAGSGDADGVSWSSTPSDSTDAVRVRFLDDVDPGDLVPGDLDPGRAFGLKVLLQRTAMELPKSTLLPWFWQYGTNAGTPEQTLTKSTFVPTSADDTSTGGGAAEAASAFVRMNFTADSSAFNGGLAGFTMSPFVIGPVLGEATVAENTTITVRMKSSCVLPVEGTLPPPPKAILTQADPGADGIPCTADDGAPAQIVFDLGDVVAEPGEVADPPLYFLNEGGHAVALDPISFQVFVAPAAQDGSTVMATAVISSDSDPTFADPVYKSGDYAWIYPFDPATSASFVVASSQSFRGAKAASTQSSGQLAPDEEFSYTIGFGNALQSSFLPATFVDVLPFPGDPRLQGSETDALANGGDPLRLTGVSASMLTPAMGGVDIFYSTADPAAAYASLETAPDGTASLFNWQAWPDSGVPAGVTALKFVTTQGLAPGFGGSATIRMQSGDVNVGGIVRNDVFINAKWDGTDPRTDDQSYRSVRDLEAWAPSGRLSGTAQWDADFDSDADDTVGDRSDVWWPADGVVELVDDAGEVAGSATIGADGAFDFGSVGVGTYGVRVQDASGWTVLAGDTVTVELDGVITDHRLVLHKVVAAPALQNDSATTTAPNPVTITVLTNDTIDKVDLPGATPPYGTQVVTIATQPSHGSASANTSTGEVTYTPAPGWTGPDTFTYSWTNVYHQTHKATVTVTTTRAALPPTLSIGNTGDGDYVLLDHGSTGASLNNVLWTDTEAGAQPSTCEADPAEDTYDARVTVTSTGRFTFESTTRGTYVYEITCTDSLNQTSNSVTNTIYVVKNPTAQDGSATIPERGMARINTQAQADAGMFVAEVYELPSKGYAAVDPTTWEATFDATGGGKYPEAGPGTYTFKVVWGDRASQVAYSQYTVTVQAKPTLPNGSTVMGVWAEDTSMTAVPGTTGTGTIKSTVIDDPSPLPSTMTVSRDETTGVLTVRTRGATPDTYSFTVTTTDNLDQTRTATFTVTVAGPPELTQAVPDTVKVAQDGRLAEFLNSLWTDTEAGVTPDFCEAELKSGPPGTASVSSVGKLEFGSLTPGEYVFSVSCTDSVGQESNAVTNTVLVREAPQADGGTATIGVGQSWQFNANRRPVESIVSAEVTRRPTQGDASVSLETDKVTFNAGTAEPADYLFEVTWTDDADQTVTKSYTVTVVAGFAVTGETSAVIPVNGSARFPMDVFPAGSAESARLTDGPSCRVGDETIDVPADRVSANASGLVTFDGADIPARAVCEFTVTFKDNLEREAVVPFTVTVAAPPVWDGVGMSAIIPEGGSVEFHANVSSELLELTAEAACSSDDAARCALEAVTKATPDGTTVFDAKDLDLSPGVYKFDVKYTDTVDQSVTVPFTVTIQAKPKAKERSYKIGVAGGNGSTSATLNGSPQADPSLAAQGLAWIVSDKTKVVSVSVKAGEDGDPDSVRIGPPTENSELSFEAAVAGVYLVSVSYFDDKDQSVTVAHTVEVFDEPSYDDPGGDGESAIIPEEGNVEFHANVTSELELTAQAACSSDATAKCAPTALKQVDPDGTVVFDAKGLGLTPGVYKFDVTYTDEVGQSVTVPFKVTIQAKPTVTPDSVRVGVKDYTDDSMVVVPDTTGTIKEITVDDSKLPGSVTVELIPTAKTGVKAAVAAEQGKLLVKTSDAPADDYEVIVTATDDLGQVSDPATFVITVQAPPMVDGGEMTVKRHGHASFDAHLSTKGEIADVSGADVPSGVTVSADVQGHVEFDAGDVPEGVYKFTETWTDDLGQTATAAYEVTVRDLQVTILPTSTVKRGDVHVQFAKVSHLDKVVSAKVITPPGQGKVSVDIKTGEIRYDASNADVGVYTYEIEWTDDLGNVARVIHNVSVWEAPIPPSPTPTPTPTPPPTPTPSPTPSPTYVGTGGTVTGGPSALPGVIGLAAAGVAILFGAALVMARRRNGDVGR